MKKYNGFSVGDKVKAISNDYFFTSASNNYIGEVIGLIGNRGHLNKNIVLKSISSNRNTSGEFVVDSDKFELIRDKDEDFLNSLY